MIYRKDIDGLRGLAIISVVFFHLAPHYFSGGYLGVDVFFVISGFLITQILLDKETKGVFKLIDFYIGRFRRLLPALFTMLMVTSVVAVLILSPTSLKEYAHSLLYVIFFISNYFFAQNTDYFSQSDEKEIILHMWSLSVEEQFYIIYPLFFILLLKKARKFLGVTLILLFSISFLYACSLDLANNNVDQFYNTPARAWELLFGSLVALYKIPEYSSCYYLKKYISTLSFLFLLFSIIFFDNHYQFTSIQNLLIVISVGLIICFNHQYSFSNLILKNNILVYIGCLSYSIYLFHQPIFVISRYLTDGDFSNVRYFIVITVCLVFSYLSYRYVEIPFRSSKGKIKKSEYFLIFSYLVILFPLALFIYKTDGLSFRFEHDRFTNAQSLSPVRSQCHSDPGGIDISERCNLNQFENTKWAVFGDSHGVEIAFSLSNKLKKHEVGVLQYTASACGPAIPNSIENKYCSNWQRKAINHIALDNSVKVVVLAFRNPVYSYDDYMNLFFKTAINPFSKFTEYSNYKSAEKQFMEKSFENYNYLINKIVGSGKKVVVIEPFPELQHGVDRYIYPPFSWLNKDFLYSGSAEKVNLVSSYFQHNEYLFDHYYLIKKENVIRVSTKNIFCDRIYCNAVENGSALYFDSNHPSLYATNILANKIIEEFIKNGYL